MPPRRIYRNAKGERCLHVQISTFPTRSDLIDSLTWASHALPFKMPKRQIDVIRYLELATLAGKWGKDYPVTDKRLAKIEECVDRLFPGLREPAP